MDSAHNPRGAAAMLAAMACFALNDALVKLASETMPASQLLFARGLWALVFLLAFAIATRPKIQPSSALKRGVWLRAGFDLMTGVSYIIAIPHIAIANATAIMMSAPFIIILVAISVFKESVNTRKWLGVAAGFSGVLFVVQPAGDAFNSWSLLVLLSAVFSACRDLVTRALPKEIPSLLLTLTNVLANIVLGAAWGMLVEWHALDTRQLMILAGAGFAVSAGFICMTYAMRSGPIGMLAPLRYTSLIFAAFTGYFIWDSIPNLLAWSGMALIAVSGVLTQSSPSRRVRG